MLKQHRICFIHSKLLFKKVKLTSESAIQDDDLTLSTRKKNIVTCYKVNIKSLHFYFISPKDTGKTAFGSLSLSPPPPHPLLGWQVIKSDKMVSFML